MGDVDVKVVEETKVSDSVVEAVRVDVGSTHQAGQDDQVGNSPDDVVADTTLYVLSFCSFSVCLQPKRCDPVVSVNKQYEPFWTAACFFSEEHEVQELQIRQVRQLQMQYTSNM